MPSMTAEEVNDKPMTLRHAVQDGEIVALTFRGKPYGYVVPADQWHEVSPSSQKHEHEQGDIA